MLPRMIEPDVSPEREPSWVSRLGSLAELTR
jgi:hypothetical protein